MPHLQQLSLLIILILFSYTVCIALDCQSNKVAHTITVSHSGRAKFTSIQKAIDSVPSGNTKWIHIQIYPGIYKEKVTIPSDKSCIFLEGSSSRRTIIEWSDHEQTNSSATFTSYPNNIVAKGIAFKNAFNIPSLRPEETPITQALAARIYGDKSAFYKCGFIGVQDTLWDATGRHYFSQCYIEGAIDFIFGGAQSMYEKCSINVTTGIYTPQKKYGFITAQGRNCSSDPSGFVFKYCTITGSGKAYLGRAYRPYSRVIMIKSTISDVVIPEGWEAWHAIGQEQNTEYVEEGCKGPGADTSKRVPWAKEPSAVDMTQEKVTIPSGKSCILLEGSTSRLTIIEWSDHESTESSATFTSNAENIVAKGITFKNAYNVPSLRPEENPTKQASAAIIYGDKSGFYSCGFIGVQDTLWDAAGRHYFNQCYIEGVIDFIFGSSQSIYEKCLINVTNGIYTPERTQGYITAQARNSKSDPSGFVFKYCAITGSGKAYLGRAYRAYSRVIMIRCSLSDVVIPEGWNAWHYVGQEQNIEYVEEGCKGPGADTSKRVRWAKQPSAVNMTQFLTRSFIDQDGWLAKMPIK
ncbi:putative pectinesterase 10 [Mangifera indica]|uniref:putative pectinesterase 10 n=1 Tax=Mangifera indica TaxID=29780 RepID=UPI001CFA5A7F|nr:putative pectinesterase 10 [Mangifera indica]